jgi:hypothetical protein
MNWNSFTASLLGRYLPNIEETVADSVSDFLVDFMVK